ncbi:TIR domain-containing protein [Marinibaculum pumilum]|uniref:TIR domain-containing protein n=1 Tax=Marinibaculum pumilum TaxID=1766165 RepID=A0ABV7L477_9PROT
MSLFIPPKGPPQIPTSLSSRLQKPKVRKVFFSFHYERDVRRVVQVRNSWVLRPDGDAQPFYDKAEFEEAKRRAGGIEHWIEQQLSGTSVTVVLFGAQTYTREWVLHEIKRSYELKKGLLAIDIHNVKDPHNGPDYAGRNPLDMWSINRAGRQVPFSHLYATYDWVRDNGYQNIGRWIEAAAQAAGR